MRTTLCILALLALAGCASGPQPRATSVSACAAGEATYACQVERYHNVNAD